MKRVVQLLLSALIIVFTIYGFSPAYSVYAESEPNDTPSLANSLTAGVVGDTNATISTSADIDW